MKIYENKILRILGFIFIWIYVFGVGICFAAKWYAIGISGAILLVVWLNSGLIGDTIYKYRVKQATKQIKRHGIQLFVDLNQCKVTRAYLSDIPYMGNPILEWCQWLFIP